MSDGQRSSDLTLLWIVMFYVGLFIFLWGFISPRATRWSTKFLGWVSIMLMLIGGTMWVYDAGSARQRTTSTLEAVTVRVARANLRSEPSTRSRQSVIGQAGRGETLPASGRQGRWYRVRFEGREAWVHAGIVRPELRHETRSTRRWPHIHVAMIVFAILYLLCVISAFRERRAADRAWEACFR